MIFKDDFRNILSQIEFDFIVTDPPYNINFKYNEYDDAKNHLDYVEMLANFANLKSVFIGYPEQTISCYSQALGIPKTSLAWCYSSNIFKQFRLINFYGFSPDLTKDFQPYKNPKDKRIKKRIENGSKGARLYSWFSDIQLVKNTSKEKTGHPCPIPEKLIERIIKIGCMEGKTIFDPFMGSGTVGVVAERMGCKFIGSEIDDKYFDIARQRLFQQPIQ